MRRGESGFTLLETLVAVIIVTLSVTVFFQLLSSSMKLERQSRDLIHEAILANQVFGNLQRQDVRAADFQWNGETAGLTWSLLILPVEVDDGKLESGEIVLTLPQELYRFEFRYRLEGRPEHALYRHATYPTGFFDDQFKGRHLSLSTS